MSNYFRKQLIQEKYKHDDDFFERFPRPELINESSFDGM